MILAIHRFILASSSPRRIQLLREAGFEFDVEPADIDESDVPAPLSPRDLATHLALAKALHVGRRHADDSPARIVLGADTVVAVDHELFAKAETPEEARRMLSRLAGTRQSVITGVAVISSDQSLRRVDAAESIVAMNAMTPSQIDTYVRSGQWRGKAGAYGIQDHDPENDPFVRLVAGEFDNVVGLPTALATEMLQSAGISRR